MATTTTNTARNASPRTQQKRPGDLTGVRGQQLAAQAAKEKAEAASQVEVAIAEEKERKRNTVVDYTGQQTPPEQLVVLETPIEVGPKFERIRVNFGIEDMTFGKEVISEGEYDDNGNMVKPPVIGNLRKFTFEEGVTYDVSADVAGHLRFLGYVWE